MVFSSIIFIFFFLPITLLIFYLLGKKIRLAFLLFSSLFFYFFGESYLIWVMILTILIDYFSALMIVEGLKQGSSLSLTYGTHRTSKQTFWLIISIVSNLALLGYFKYFNFFIENALQLLDFFQLDNFKLDTLAKVTLPLGISFYTFQSMSYTIDVYRGNISANRNLVKYATFVTMFPQLIAGPIVRYRDIASQLEVHNIRFNQIYEGIQRFMIGLAKKVLIANTFASIADEIFQPGTDYLSSSVAWIGLVAFFFQIYYDFSGYSCMAIGMGKMLGFNFPENFDYPYTAKSEREFWQRWHITLSKWLRDYLFIPINMGMSKRFNQKLYFGIKTKTLTLIFSTMITMLLCGIWHGAGWNFIIWGLYIGIFMSLEKIGLLKLLIKLPSFISHMYLIFIVLIGCLIFRTESVSEVIRFLRAMFVYAPDIDFTALKYINPINLIIFSLAVLFSMPVIPKIMIMIEAKSNKVKNVYNFFFMVTLFGLFLLSVVTIASGSYNPFIYFRF